MFTTIQPRASARSTLLNTPRPTTPDSAPRSRHVPSASGLLAAFAGIHLDEMASVALLDRVDTKFLMNVGQLERILPDVVEDYRILDVDGVRLNSYRTLYFDTGDFALYMRHHAGGQNRYKVRSRAYVESRTSFLEVKCKHGVRRTTKHRVQTPEMIVRLSSKANHFLRLYAPLDPRILEPKLWNTFRRITLVNERDRERVTVDVDLGFTADGRAASMPGLVVVEVKQGGVNHESDFVRSLRRAGLHAVSFSKYCVGVSLLFHDVKHNNFKPEMRLAGKLMKGNNDDIQLG